MSKLTFGIGFNSGGLYEPSCNNSYTDCYNKWLSILKRCYYAKDKRTQRSYEGCTVFQPWHDFQVFAEWYYNTEYSDYGYALDKDLLSKGDKIYSPENCSFVPTEINNLLIANNARRGDYPQGVSLNKNKKRFIAHIRINSKSKHLGVFDTPSEAHQVYKIAKEAYVKEKALEWQDRIADNVFQALMDWQLTE